MKFWACVLAIMVPGIVMADIASTTYTDKALSSKADDSTVVHKTGDETIGGTKTFSNTIVSTSPIPFTALGATLRSNDVNGLLSIHGSKINRLNLQTDNNNGVDLLVDDQYDKKITLIMKEQNTPTIELTNNDGYEASALIMKDDTGNKIQMGKAYTGRTELFMTGESNGIILEGESSDTVVVAEGETAGISASTPNGAIRLLTAPGYNNGNPTLMFRNAAGKEASISFDSTNYINLDQHLKAPSATIDGGLTIGNHITLTREVPSDFDNNTVPDTKWVNDRIEDARGVIPVGGADGTETAQIWIE